MNIHIINIRWFQASILQGRLHYQGCPKSFGMGRRQTFFLIRLPQAWRFALPGIGNLWQGLIKDTSLVSVITVTELLRSAQEIIASTYQPLPLYLAAAAIYWILCQVLEWVQHWYEKRLALPARH